MTCQEFETVVIDLARFSAASPAMRERGLAHAEACARCAARLADERALGVGLRAAGAGISAPSPRLEAALLTAFRAQHAAPAPPAKVVAFTPRAPRRLAYAMAAAVVVAAFVGLIALSMRRSSQTVPLERAGNTTQIAAPSPTPESAAPTPSTNQVAGVNESGNDTRDSRESSSPRVKRAGRDSSRRGLFARRDTGVRTLPVSANAPAVAAEETIATEFMPLGGGGGLSGMDGGQIVRVEVPRSALASFGLPVDAERAGGRVKADVVLGHDGVARAIRFVR